MPEPLRLTLPLPPSANRYWRYTQGRVLVSRKALEEIDQIARAALDALAAVEHGEGRDG